MGVLPKEEPMEEFRVGVDSYGIEYPPDGSARQIAPPLFVLFV